MTGMIDRNKGLLRDLGSKLRRDAAIATSHGMREYTLGTVEALGPRPGCPQPWRRLSGSTDAPRVDQACRGTGVAGPGSSAMPWQSGWGS
jgi:hypothetical protein